MASSSSFVTCCGCGKEIEDIYDVEQCRVCLGWLCPDCNAFGLCPAHFDELNPQDQEVLRINDEMLDSVQKRMAWCRYLVLYRFLPATIGIFIALVIVGSIYYSDILLTMIIIVVICLSISGILIYYYFQFRSRIPAIDSVIEGIIFEYPHLAEIRVKKQDGL